MAAVLRGSGAGSKVGARGNPGRLWRNDDPPELKLKTSFAGRAFQTEGTARAQIWWLEKQGNKGKEKKGEEGKRRESCSCGGGAGQAESWEADCKGSREVLEGAAACSGAPFLREGK